MSNDNQVLGWYGIKRH